jgi:hypothetical protein
MLSMNGLLALDGWLALGMIFLLPALEAPALFGLVLPGELVLVLGGVLAQQGRPPRSGRSRTCCSATPPVRAGTARTRSPAGPD